MGGELNVVFFFKQKTEYDIRKSDWSSDVCSSDLLAGNDKLAFSWTIDAIPAVVLSVNRFIRSEERRVGKEGRSRWSPYHHKKQKNNMKKHTPHESYLCNVPGAIDIRRKS